MWAFLKRLWYGETSGLAAGAFIVGVASIAADIAGVVRDRLLAATFGASHSLDAYYAAFRIPDTLYNLFILGALSAGFVPLFAEYAEKKGHEKAMELVSQVFSLIAAVMAVICVIGAVFAHIFVPLTVPGFDPETRNLTIQLSRIIFLSPLFLGLSSVIGGALQSTKRFFCFSLAPVLYNIGIIFGIIFFVPLWGIHGVVVGVVIGALLHLIAQLSVAVDLGLPRLPKPSLKPEGVRRLLRLMLPRTAGLAVTQINLTIILLFASSVGEGSVAVFNLANNLQSFALGLIGISFAIAAFPVLSRAIGASKPEIFTETFQATARKVLFFIFPMTALFILLRSQIVRTVLGDGKFNWDDTRRTFDVLGLLAISLPAQCLVPLLARSFYALQDSWTPFGIGLIAEAINLFTAWALHRTLGITGLAIAFSLSAGVNAILLLLILRTRQSIFQAGGAMLTFLFQVTVGTVALSAITYFAKTYLGFFFSPLHAFWQVFLQGAASGILGIFAFMIVMRLFRSPELQEAWTGGMSFARKLQRKMNRA